MEYVKRCETKDIPYYEKKVETVSQQFHEYQQNEQSSLASLTEQDDMMLEIQVLSWDRHKDVMELTRSMGSQTSSLDNWISNVNTYINKPHTITKMKDNINMDSIIAGSVLDTIT